VPLALSKPQRSNTINSPKVDVTARSKELRCDGLVAALGRGVERRATSVLNIDATASCNKLFRDGHKPLTGSAVERRENIGDLVVDEGLCALCRQQRANLRCVTITRGIPKLLPRNSFPAP
jgi:hypothetical protein